MNRRWVIVVALVANALAAAARAQPACTGDPCGTSVSTSNAFLTIVATSGTRSATFTVPIQDVQEFHNPILDIWYWQTPVAIPLSDGGVNLGSIISLTASAARATQPDGSTRWGVDLDWSVAGGTGVTTYTIYSPAMSFERLTYAEATTSASLVVTSQTGDGVTLTPALASGHAYEAIYNGSSTFRQYFNSPLTAPGTGSNSAAGNMVPTGSFAPILVPVSCMQSRVAFALSPLDSAGGTSTYAIAKTTGVGACCAPDATCTVGLQSACPAGSFWTLGVTCSPTACSMPRYYVGPDGGLWSAGANWSGTPGGAGGAGSPADGQNVYISSTTNKSLTLDTNYAAPGLNSLTIGGSAGARCTVNHPSGAMYVSGSEYLGTQVGGGAQGLATYSQAGGTHTVGGTLTIGSCGDPAANCVYDLQSGILTVGNLINNGTMIVQSGSVLDIVGILAGNPVTFTGSVVFTGGTVNSAISTTVNSVITKASTNELTIVGGQSYAPGSVFDSLAGSTRFNTRQGSSGANANLTIQVNTSTVRQQVTGVTQQDRVAHVAAIISTMPGTTTMESVLGHQTLVANGLTLDHTNGARLDIGDNTFVLNHLDLDHGAAKTAIMTAWARSGRNTGTGGEWTGTGILSRIAAANPGTAVGILNNDDASIGGTGLPIYTTFQGATVTTQSILARYVALGDANLDGAVDVADLELWARGLQGASMGGPIDWAHGDFDYNSAVAMGDLLLLARSYNAVHHNVDALNTAITASPFLTPQQRTDALLTTCLAHCPADFSCDAIVTVGDVFDYLNAWFAANPRSDFNGNGLSVSDIFDYLNAWLAGCP